MIRVLTSFLAFVLFTGAAHATAVRMTPPAGVTGNPSSSSGWSTASNFTGTFSAASFNSNFTTNVGGKPVTMPASMRMAANAGQFASAAVRLNPAGLVGGAVAAWLLANGIEYLEGQFKSTSKTSETSGTGYWEFDANARGSSISEVCSKLTNRGVYATCTDTGQRSGSSGKQATVRLTYLPAYCSYCAPIDAIVAYVGQPTCPGGMTWNNGYCVGLALTPDSKWNDLAVSPFPDAAASELASKVPLPLENPQFNPKQVDVPLGDPRIDPTTGKPVQDKARLTPSSDGQTANVDMYTEPLNPDGTPETDPDGTPKAPTEKTPEFCELHPASLVCQDMDTPGEKDITNKDKTLTITPDSGWGPSTASCPADKVSSLRSGGAVTISYEGACLVATSFRPVVLAFAWLSAILIAIGITQRYG